MTKNILFIFVFDVKVKRFFFLTRDVIIYRRNRFHESTIKSIMILKKTFNVNRSRKTKKIFLNLTSVFFEWWREKKHNRIYKMNKRVEWWCFANRKKCFRQCKWWCSFFWIFYEISRFVLSKNRKEKFFQRKKKVILVFRYL